MRRSYSLVVPVYRNESCLPALLDAVEGIAAQLDGPLEAVFVVDGSPDASHALLRSELPGRSFPSQLIQLSRNFGSFAAVRHGLAAARGPYFAVLAADLQEPPELAVEFLTRLADDEADVAVGCRTSRGDGLVSRLFSATFWAVYRRLLFPEMPPGGVDVFAINARVRDVLVDLEEANSTLIGLLFWVGFRRIQVPYARRERHSGVSGWTFHRKLRYMLDSCLAFTDLPIAALGLVALVCFVGFSSLAVAIFAAWYLGRIPVPGYTPIMLTILVSTNAILLGQAVLGAYVWRAFENTKGRPNAIEQRREEFPGAAPAAPAEAVG